MTHQIPEEVAGAERNLIVKRWQVGEYVCTLTIPRPASGRHVTCTVTWFPVLPVRLTDIEAAEYRRGHDQAMRVAAKQLGTESPESDE